ANAAPFYSIYDAGGNDTIDASGFDVSQFIDLHDGAFSSIGGGVPSADEVNAYWTDYYADYGLDFTPDLYWTDAELQTGQIVAQIGMEFRIERDTGVDGIYATQFDNVSIAYGTIIENAIGGSARDLLRGNDVANELSGMGGDDVLVGFGDDDTLTGGDGDDLFVFANDGSTDTIADFQTGADRIDLTALDGVTAADVSYNSTTHQVEINLDHTGDADMFINSMNVVGTGDYLFHV
ncbi:MAG TPA: M10 family metallopeptidase C-terminal domain-containing protein, partial [Sphingomicrobium sp.]|nr:M10 family metallopeptidase C-terminal domain-containing protein [Sphingomicrobium sp.]